MKIFLAFACNSGVMRVETFRSLAAILLAPDRGHEFVIQFGGGSDVGAVRNLLLHHFRTRTDCEACLFIDTDEVFNVAQICTMGDWMDRHPQIQMLGGLYPLKGSNPVRWSFGGNPAESDVPGLWNVFELAGGCMMLRRSLVEGMIAQWPETEYIVEDWAYRSETAYDLAQMGVVKDRWCDGQVYRRRVPEDYMLSWRTRKLGHPIYVDPRIQMGHIGAIDHLKLLPKGATVEALPHF